MNVETWPVTPRINCLCEYSCRSSLGWIIKLSVPFQISAVETNPQSRFVLRASEQVVVLGETDRILVHPFRLSIFVFRQGRGFRHRINIWNQPDPRRFAQGYFLPGSKVTHPTYNKGHDRLILLFL